MCSVRCGVSCCADPPPFGRRGEEMAVTHCKPVMSHCSSLWAAGEGAVINWHFKTRKHLEQELCISYSKGTAAKPTEIT